MKTKGHKQHAYLLRVIERDAQSGRFEHELEAAALSDVSGRKEAEYRAREKSRAHPRELVTLSRNGSIISHLVNGRAVDPLAIVGDAAAGLRAKQRSDIGTLPLPPSGTTIENANRMIADHLKRDHRWHAVLISASSNGDELLVNSIVVRPL